MSLDEECEPLLQSRDARSHMVKSTSSNTHVRRTSQANFSDQPKRLRRSSDNQCDSEDSEDYARENENDANAVRNFRQNWLQYFDSFHTFLPFIFAFRTAPLVLYHLGIVVAVLSQRGLRVMIPLSLGVRRWTRYRKKTRLKPCCGSVSMFSLSILNFSTMSAVIAWCWFRIEQDCTIRLQKTTYDHLMRLSYDFHQSVKPGKLMQAVSNGKSVISLFQKLMIDMLPTVVDLFVAVFVFWFVFDRYVAFVVATAATLFWALSNRSLPTKLVLRREYIKAFYAEWNQFYESITNWTTVSYFNRRPYETTRFADRVHTSQDSSFENFRYERCYALAKDAVLYLALLMCCCLIMDDIVTRKTKPVGKFVTLISFWVNFTGPLTNISLQCRRCG